MTGFTHYREINVLGVYVAPAAPLILLGFLLCLILFRLFERVGLSRHVWHPSLFNFAVYAIVVCLLVLLDGAI